MAGTALALSAVAGPGRRFLVGAWSALRARTPHMDLPIALGLSIGAVTGTVNAVRGVGEVYFDSLSTLVFLLLIGRWVQHKQQEKAARAVDLMVRLTPVHATRIDVGGGQSEVLADRLQTGDRVLVRPGESIPVDGNVLEGTSEVDRGLLTGESEPIAVGPGAEVAAGEVNLTEVLVISVRAVGANTRMGRVMQRIDEAAAERSPIVLLADRVGGYFVVTVAALALACIGYWWAAGPQIALSRASALLIVACPCALALATPLAVAVAIGRSARQQVLIRDGQALQRLAGAGTMWLDKTGTLTTGRRRVTQSVGDASVLPLAAALQQHCRHSVATAVVQAAQRQHMSLPGDVDIDPAVPGGVSGTVAGQRVVVGNVRFLEQAGVNLDADWDQRAEELVDASCTPVLVAVDGRVRLLLGISDALRPEAPAVIDTLQASGWRVGLLSGDHPQVVARVGAELGIDAERIVGGADPETKLAVVRRSRQQGQRVVMVGDGANDAAALAAADVGVAMRGGAEASLLAAPVYIGTGDLKHLAWLVRNARRTQSLIYQTFAASLAYNALAVVLAWQGTITPLMAAVLMPLSSVTVVSWTFLHRHFDPGKIP
ncbi:MAG: cation-translocating P-type ATPase [Planctomycetota bacterium]|nr:MAG: cation-translocating P-type ATPase [Planctomycetota bacterium]